MLCKNTFYLPAVVVLSIIAHKAAGGVSEIEDKQEWMESVAAFTTIDFTGFPDGTILRDQYADLGILFTDVDDNIFLNENAFPNDGAGANSSFFNSLIMASFDVPQSWVAAEFPPCIHIELYRRGALIYRSSRLGTTGVGNFGGLISDEPFDAVVIVDPNGDTNIDDLHFGAGAVSAKGLLLNSGFEREGASGPRVAFTGVGVGPESAAADWLIVNTTEGTTTTKLEASTLTGGQSSMLHVVTDGPENGIMQDAFPSGLGLDCGLAAVWVRVIRGEAFISIGNGDEEATARRFNRRKFVWERLDLLNVECPARRISVMSGPGEGGAEFFVDHAALAPLCPCEHDLDNSRRVDLADILALVEAWGTDPGCRPDFDEDGDVGVTDLLDLLGAWGRCEGR